jgi:threonine dehydrogenase-like Zn-dependent dehydrogenase
MWAQLRGAPFTFEKVEVHAPAAADLRAGQVLLAVQAGGICGSDLPFVRGGVIPPRVPGAPLHEVVGEVVASAHPAHQPGTMVVGWASGFDGLAEFVVSDGEQLSPYDTSLAATTAVMLQPLACVLYVVHRLGELRGKTAAVVGQGPIGLLFSHVLKQCGASHVIGVDRVDRSESAHVFGVDEVVTADATLWSATLPDAGRPSVVIEAVGHQVSTLKACLDSVAFGGEVFYFGLPDDPVYPFDMVTFLRKNLTLRSGGTLERRRVLAEADAYLADHAELRESYVSHVYHVGDAADAFAAANQPRPGQYKIAIDMSSGRQG